MFLPQNKGYVSNKSRAYALYECDSSYDTMSYVTQN